MTIKPHDALFKAIFGQPRYAAELFRHRLPRQLRDRIDWSTLISEDGSFIDPELSQTHSDLLFSTNVGGVPVLLYLLLEHQSTNDPFIALRMLEYIVRISKRHFQRYGTVPVVIPLVVSHAPQGWTAPTSYHPIVTPNPAEIGIADLVPNFTLLVEDLAHLTNAELKSRALSEFPMLALRVLSDARDIRRLLRNSLDWVDTFRAAFRTPHGVEALAQVYRYVSIITDRMTFEEFRANTQAGMSESERRTMTKSMAEEWVEEGVIKGRQEGRVEGRVEGERDGQIRMLTQLLSVKFGALPTQYANQLHSANQAQLDNYAQRLLETRSIADVFAD